MYSSGSYTSDASTINQARTFHADEQLVNGAVRVPASRLPLRDIEDDEVTLRKEWQRLFILSKRKTPARILNDW